MYDTRFFEQKHMRGDSTICKNAEEHFERLKYLKTTLTQFSLIQSLTIAYTWQFRRPIRSGYTFNSQKTRWKL